MTIPGERHERKCIKIGCTRCEEYYKHLDDPIARGRVHFENCIEMDRCGTCDDFWKHRNHCVLRICPCSSNAAA